MKNKIKLLSLVISFLGISLVCSAQQPAFPLKRSANNRYLVDQNNTPFPILGRTAWFVISLSVSDYKTFISNTVSHGYNSIEMHVINHDPNANHPPFNGNGDIPFLKRLCDAVAIYLRFITSLFLTLLMPASIIALLAMGFVTGISYSGCNAW